MSVSERLPLAPDLLVRELAACDRPALAFVFGRLGPRSRYQRFLAAKPELDARELERFARVDHWHHDALIAFSPPPRAPVAVARYVRLEDFDTAELAVEVVDAWQRRGVGRALVLALRDRALRAGIRRFRATLLRENRGARALVRELGRVERATIGADGVLELEIVLAPPTAQASPGWSSAGGRVVAEGPGPAERPRRLVRGG